MSGLNSCAPRITHVHCLAVGLEQLRHVELGSLQDLSLSNIDVMQGVNALLDE